MLEAVCVSFKEEIADSQPLLIPVFMGSLFEILGKFGTTR